MVPPVCVAGWIARAEARRAVAVVEVWGGCFVEGMRWCDYLDTFPPAIHPYLTALRQELSRRSPAERPVLASQVPCFENGAVGRLDTLAWGDLLAALSSEEEDRDYSYATFCVPPSGLTA